MLFGKDAKPEKCISIEVKKFKHGLALDLTGNKSMFGFGISKDLYKNNLIEIDAGVYATKRVNDLLSGNYKPDLKIGFSAKVKF